jgi:hypothetical protein
MAPDNKKSSNTAKNDKATTSGGKNTNSGYLAINKPLKNTLSCLHGW